MNSPFSIRTPYANELLLMEVAKSLKQIVENTHPKQQEISEIKMNSCPAYFQPDHLLKLNKQWIMVAFSLKASNTVFSITPANDNLPTKKDTRIIKNVSGMKL